MNVTREIEEIYDKIADRYYEFLWDDMPYNKQLDKFSQLIKGPNVLDIGCAIGSFTKYIASKGFMVDGFDLSSNLIEIAKREVKNANFFKMDMLNMNISKKYDGIMLINSIIHIKKSDMQKLFKDIYKLLNDDGVVFLILLEGEGEQYVDEPLDTSISEFVNFYMEDEIEKVFFDASLEIILKEKIMVDADTELGSTQLVYYLKK